MSNNQCPLCSKINCIDTVDFTVNGVNYRGIRCNECNNMLYSYNLKTEDEFIFLADKSLLTPFNLEDVDGRDLDESPEVLLKRALGKISFL